MDKQNSLCENKICNTYYFQLSSCQMITLNWSKCIFFDKKSFGKGKLILLSRDPTNSPYMGLHRSHGRFYHTCPCWQNLYQLWQVSTETVQYRDWTLVAGKLILTPQLPELPQVISTSRSEVLYHDPFNALQCPLLQVLLPADFNERSRVLQ